MTKLEQAARQALRVLKAERKSPAVEQEPVKYLANGTRFKMSFFQNEDSEGNPENGTYVTCFEAFEKELDGRWVALVAAEDDCHLNQTAPLNLSCKSVQARLAAQWGYVKADAVEQKPVTWIANEWSVFNTGAEVASGLSLNEAMDYLTDERAHGIGGET